MVTKELGNSYFTTLKTIGGYQYDFQDSMHGDPKNWMGDTRTPRRKEVERYFSSAESFRDAALAELAALETNARKRSPSGAAILTVREPPRGGIPPKEVKRAPDIMPTKDQLAAILDEALADIEQRRKLVRAHHRDMFDAT